MASLVQTLQVFRAFLNAKGALDISEADEAIWAYLRPAQGLRAQVDALDVLNVAMTGMSQASPRLPVLQGTIDLHRHRLAEPYA